MELSSRQAHHETPRQLGHHLKRLTMSRKELHCSIWSLSGICFYNSSLFLLIINPTDTMIQRRLESKPHILYISTGTDWLICFPHYPLIYVLIIFVLCITTFCILIPSLWGNKHDILQHVFTLSVDSSWRSTYHSGKIQHSKSFIQKPKLCYCQVIYLKYQKKKKKSPCQCFTIVFNK